MKSQRFRPPTWVLPLGTAAILMLLSWIFVGISIESVVQGEAGSCFSVVLDKPFVKDADRVVIYAGGRSVTVTDRETVRRIADLFTTANRTGLCDYVGDLQLELYNGHRLVRKVTENCSGGLFHIYDQDLLHWVFPSVVHDGQVELSHEDYLWLTGIIAQYE